MKEFDPAHAAANGYTYEDWDAVDSPELTDEELAKARPLREAMPDLYAALANRRKRSGRNRDTVSVPLDRDVAEKFSRTGEGWEIRVNDILRRAKIEAAGS